MIGKNAPMKKSSSDWAILVSSIKRDPILAALSLHGRSNQVHSMLKPSSDAIVGAVAGNTQHGSQTTACLVEVGELQID